MRRNLSLGLLLCANLALLAGILSVTSSLPLAHAQTAGLSGSYLSVAGEMQSDYDALYLLDQKSRVLHVFYFDKTARKLMHADARDLERDFRNNRN